MMNSECHARKKQIAERFSASAVCYDEKAQIQAEIGRDALARWGQHSCQRLLDIGCGTGALTAQLGATSAQVFGCDLSLGMLRVASQNAGMHWLAGDADCLPLQSHCFDGIFSSMALQWSENIQRCFKEVHRVAQPGAKVLLGIMSEGSIHELQQSWAAIDDQPHTNQFHTEPQLLRAAQLAGFTGEAQTTVFRSWHDSVLAVMHSIKDIGAGLVNNRENVTPLTKSRLARINRYYQQHFGEHDRLPLSYYITYLELTK